MFGFLSRKLRVQIWEVRNYTTHLKFQHTYSSLKPISEESSFTVSYLVNSCGLSSESALSVANKIHLKSPKNPDSVLKFFQNHGFSKTHVTKIITKWPRILLSDPDKTLEPKIQFLYKIGFQAPKLVKVIASNPFILQPSLEKKIKPFFNFLKALLYTDQNVTQALTCRPFSWTLQFYALKGMEPKLSLLRHIGMPESGISKLVKMNVSILTYRASVFEELIKKVCEMGLNPSDKMFIYAIHVKIGISDATWEAKLEVFKSFGWSEYDILLAIRNNPLCMQYSKKKIRVVLDYLMKKLNWNPLFISQFMQVFGYSLEKRVIPRLSVIQVLLSKGMVKKKLSIANVLSISEVKFLDMYVTKFNNESQQLLKVYQGKMQNP